MPNVEGGVECALFNSAGRQFVHMTPRCENPLVKQGDQTCQNFQLPVEVKQFASPADCRRANACRNAPRLDVTG